MAEPDDDPRARRLHVTAVRAALARLARAAESPWLHAEVARRMAERLDFILLEPELIVDWWGFLGAGDALLKAKYPKAQRIVVEPGAPWLERSRARATSPWWRGGRWAGGQTRVQDADEPLPDAAQLVWCNMALHLVRDPPALFARWQRGLRADGFVMFSCLGPGTLRELRSLYARLGWPAPTADFVDMHDLGDMLVEAGFADPVMDQETLDLRWASPQALLAELRTLGGNTAPDRTPGLRTPRWRRRLETELDTLRGADGKIGMSIEVAYGHAFKAAPRLRSDAPTTVSLADMRAMVRRSRPPEARQARCARLLCCASAPADPARVAVAVPLAVVVRAAAEMSATLVVDSTEHPSAPAGLRFGRLGASEGGIGSVEWQLKRNCSISPAQSMACFAGLCMVSLGIGTMFWWQGAPLVMPFAGLELLVVAGLLLLYARHATDRETIHLSPAGWVVERADGRNVERLEFGAFGVRVGAGRRSGELVELSGQGRRVHVGRFVRPELRRQLADELRWAQQCWQRATPGESPAAGWERQTMNRRQA